MNVCPDPKADYARHPGDDSYYLSFEVFYNNPTDTARVRLSMPCASTARALCNFLNDHAQKAPADPTPLDKREKSILEGMVDRIIVLENSAKESRKWSDHVHEKQSALNIKFREEIDHLGRIDCQHNKDIARLEETIRLAYNARKQQSDRIDALAGEVKELERLRGLMATHVTELYSRVEEQKNKLADAVREVIRPDRIADPERVDRVLAAQDSLLQSMNRQLTLHHSEIERLQKKWRL